MGTAVRTFDVVDNFTNLMEDIIRFSAAGTLIVKYWHEMVPCVRSKMDFSGMMQRSEKRFSKRTPRITGRSLSLPDEAPFLRGEVWKPGGEGGIRTLDSSCPLCRFSKPVPSATRPPLRLNHPDLSIISAMYCRPVRLLNHFSRAIDSDRDLYSSR